MIEKIKGGNLAIDSDLQITMGAGSGQNATCLPKA
jgi:hypothetical protein